MNNLQENITLCLLQKQLDRLNCYELALKIKIPEKIKTKNIECLTLDNIFHCNERNRWFYQSDDVYDDILDVGSIEIGCHYISKYKTKYIKGCRKGLTKKTIIENLKIKHYIKIGEKCSICLEKIYHKSNAILSDCGHSFHYSCIMKNDNYCWGKNNWGNCPNCRQYIGEYEYLKNIYRNDSKYILDKLENFWDNIKTITPNKCFDRDNNCNYYNIHDKGMNNNCLKCIKYKKTGYKCND